MTGNRIIIWGYDVKGSASGGGVQWVGFSLVGLVEESEMAN